MNEKYIRRKGRWKTGEAKYVIELNGKYIRTVPMVEELEKLLRQDTLEVKQSDNAHKSSTDVPQKYPQSILSEPIKEDKNKTLSKLSDEELKKLWELTKE